MPQKNQDTDMKPSRQLMLRESILRLATGGMAIALATVLSYFKLFKMAQGGSVTAASMLPIIFCALALGPAWGIGIGAAYGVLQLILEPYVVHWAQLLLDYPIAFGLLGLAGFFAASKQSRLMERNILYRLSMVPLWRIVVGIIVGVAGRLAASVTSGFIFFAEYAPEGSSPVLYSLGYNASYLLPEMVILIVILIPLAAVFRRRRI